MLTAERLRELLSYDIVTGEFKNLATRGRVKAGSVVIGSPNKAGYLRLRVDGELHYAHRLAWLWVTGAWPEKHIDHINQVKTDNRIANLREATSTENKQNVSSVRPLPGAQKHRDKFHAKIRVNGKHVYIGTFNDAKSASAAYLAAKNDLHPFDASIPPRIR